jgi:nucleoside-diphosphate-sugar epimerase
VETGGRRHIRDFLYVKDVARAFVSLLESSVTGPVNIASGEGISIAAMEKEIGRVMGKPVRHKAGARKTGAAGEPEQLVADSSRLRREVGFAPAYSFARALKNTADWWCGRDHAAKGRR